MNYLLKKYLEGETNQAENRRVFEWIKRSEKNEQQFKIVRLLHDIEIWRDDAAVSFMKEEENKNQAQRPLIRILVRVGAACILAMGLFYLFQHMSSDDHGWIAGKSNDKTEEMSVPTGQYAELVLDDGTKVWLNSKSTLYYPRVFTGKERIVRLHGEGYFDVTHDPGRPFRVETKQYDIKVLGTAFNVRAYEDVQPFETSLLRGSVMVRSVETSENLCLKPNEKLIDRGEKFDITSFNKDEFLWREGVIFIDDKSIDEILPLLEQYFDIHFIIKENGIGQQKKYTGKFRIRDGVEHILNVLRIQNKFSYKMEQDNMIYIE